RSREMTIRLALGATRARLVRQMLTESVGLALVSSAVGLLINAWTLDVLIRIAPVEIPRVGDARIDTVVVAFTVGIGTLAGLMFGLAPALQVRAGQLGDALSFVGRGAIGGGDTLLRQVLVVAEVALSLVLLITAALLVQSFVLLQRVPTG